MIIDTENFKFYDLNEKQLQIIKDALLIIEIQEYHLQKRLEQQQKILLTPLNSIIEYQKERNKEKLEKHRTSET